VPGSCPVAGSAQHPAQVDDGLGVDVLVYRRVEVLRRGADGNGELAVRLLHDRADRPQQGNHCGPPDVVAYRVLEQLTQRVAVVVAQVPAVIAAGARVSADHACALLAYAARQGS